MLHHMNRASLATSRDPNFDNVTLLLHGDGTNGGQNNTFVDSSSNNYAITRNGNPTQGTFSPYGTLWSNYFDGTDDYLSVADNTALRPGAGAFTLEAWIFRNVSGVAHTIYAKGGASTGIVFQVTSGNILRFTHTTTNIDSTGTIAANTWTHVSVVREGTGTNQTKLYINGIQDGQGTVTTDFTQTEEVRIGTNRSAGEDFSGYISNLRFVKGTAVYTANFTPPTEPLTAITNTSLLTCQSNRFIDNSSNAFTITRNGNVSIQRFSPFNPPGEYSTTIIGGSGYFDGTGDYLTVADNAALEFPTQDFTIECWVFLNSLPSSGNTVTITQKGIIASNNFEWAMAIRNNSGVISIRAAYSTNGSTNTTIDSSGVNFVDNSWNHIALTRSGTALNFWFNGQSAGSSNTWPSTLYTGTGIVGIGGNQSGASLITGYICDLRLVKGTRVYTGTFTPPTLPLTAITNTSLLCNFTNASIIDNAMMNDLETVGNAQISTSVRRFGTGSLAFDGTGDYLIMPNTPNLDFGTGAFTIECWFYINGNSASTAAGRVAALIASFISSGNTFGYYLRINGDSTTTGTGLQFVNAVNNVDYTITYTGTISQGTWHHVAVVRSGTTTTIYFNGTNVASGTLGNQTVSNYTYPTQVGRLGYPSFSYDFNGYIDDLRVTKGVARYTANFTPRNTPFPNM